MSQRKVELIPNDEFRDHTKRDMRIKQLQAQKGLLQSDLLICDRLNHTAWDDIGECCAKTQASAMGSVNNDRGCGFTYKQSNHESPYWHLRMPQLDANDTHGEHDGKQYEIPPIRYY